MKISEATSCCFLTLTFLMPLFGLSSSLPRFPKILKFLEAYAEAVGDTHVNIFLSNAGDSATLTAGVLKGLWVNQGLGVSIRKVDDAEQIGQVIKQNQVVGLNVWCLDQPQDLLPFIEFPRQSLIRDHPWLMIGNIVDIMSSLGKPYLSLDNQITFASVDNTSSEVTLLEVYSLNRDLTPVMQPYGKWAENSPVMISGDSWVTRRSNLTGLHLRCTTMEQPPFVQLSNPDEQLNVDIIGGYAGDVWHTLQEILGFTYKCYKPPDGKFGVKSKGVWNGLVKEVLDDRADVVVTSLDHNNVRREAVDFLLSLREVGYQLIARQPGLMEQTWTSFTSELMPASWIATIIFTLLIPLCLYICARVSPLETEKVTLKDAYILAVGALAYQGSWLEVKSTSTRIVFISIFMATLLIYSYYTSALVSLLTVASTSTGISSLQELLIHKKYGFGFRRDISIQEEFLGAQSGLYHDVWHELTTGVIEDLPKTNEEGVNKVRSESYVFMMEENIYRASFYNFCDVTVIKEKYFVQESGFAFAKGSPLLEIFNAQLQKMLTGGILNRQWERWQPPSALCTSDGVVSLGLVQLFTAFLILLLGIVLALVFLPCERLHWNIIGKSKHSRTP